MNLPLYHVDVFAEAKYAGNQLAVIRNAADLSTLEMQKIAVEMNFSETSFILSDQERAGGYDVRIFTLDEELPFAGHPTLGTAYIIQQEIIKKEVPEIRLNLQIGQIPVTFNYKDGKPDVLWMKQVAPTFGKTFAAEDVAVALNLDPSLIDSRYPVQEVSTGLPFIIVPLVSLDAVRAASVDRVGFMRLIDKSEAKLIFIFCPETYDPSNQVNGRMFDSHIGIGEDPATGSANGCLASYLVKHRYFGDHNIDIRVEQGYEIGRPSLLLLRAQEEEGGAISVSVGGSVIMVARGELF